MTYKYKLIITIIYTLLQNSAFVPFYSGWQHVYFVYPCYVKPTDAAWKALVLVLTKKSRLHHRSVSIWLWPCGHCGMCKWPFWTFDVAIVVCGQFGLDPTLGSKRRWCMGLVEVSSSYRSLPRGLTVTLWHTAFRLGSALTTIPGLPGVVFIRITRFESTKSSWWFQSQPTKLGSYSWEY